MPASTLISIQVACFILCIIGINCRILPQRNGAGVKQSKFANPPSDKELPFITDAIAELFCKACCNNTYIHERNKCIAKFCQKGSNPCLDYRIDVQLPRIIIKAKGEQNTGIIGEV